MNPPVSSSQAPFYEVIPDVNQERYNVQYNAGKSNSDDVFYDLLQAVDESKAKELIL